MTVEVTTSRITYTGAGTTGPFSINFYFLANADIKAFKVLISDGTQTELTLTTDYTLTGAGDADGGTLTLTSSLSSDYKLVIYRDPEVLQESAYPKNDPFPAATHETVVDRLTMICQRLVDRIGRTIRLLDSDTTGVTLTLPAATAAARSDKVIGFNTDGDELELKGSTDSTVLAAQLASSAAGNGAALVAFAQSGIGQVALSSQTNVQGAINTLNNGLGSMALQNSTAVAITGGSVAGIAALAVADGGTGAPDAATARSNLSVPSYAQHLTAKFNAGALTLRLLKNSATKAPFVGIDSYTDAYNDSTGVNAGASTNENFDSRGGWQPTRSGASTVISEPFDSLASWTDIDGGSGVSSSVVVSGTGDPAIDGNVLDLATGGTGSSVAGRSRDVGTIPATFGVMFIARLVAVGTNQADGLSIEIGNVNGHNLRLLLNDSAFYVFQDGAYRLLFAHGGDFYTEWWVQVTDGGSGTYTVDLYAGTEHIGQRTGVLPSSATDGLVIIQQLSGATTMRESLIAIMQIGTSQLPDNLTLISTIQTAKTQPTKARIVVLGEDDANEIVVNTDLIAKVSRDGGTTYSAVTLADRGVWGAGIIDSTKDVNAYCGEVDVSGQPAGTSMVYRIESSGGKYHTLNGVYLEWE